MKTQYIPDENLALIREYLRAEDKALIDIIRFTGYRVEDVLRTRDYQWSGESISITEQKTGKVRTVEITEPLKNTVERYRRLAHYKSASPLRYFVPSRRNRPNDKRKLHRTTIYRNFQKAVKKAGFEGKGYSIHSLRKCYAVALLRSTGSLEAVRRDLGHKYISTTFMYCEAAYTLQIPATLP